MGTINVSITDPGNRMAHNSLHNWLNNNQYIKDNAQLTLLDSPPDGMGPELEVIQLVLSSGFDLAQLALAFAEWRARSRETAAPIAVQANGRRTELSLDDMADNDDEKYVIRRALAGAPDPRRSRCVLIGVSDYVTLRQLPGVRQNLVQLRQVLVDSRIWGIPSERVQEIDYSQSVSAIKDAISDAGRDAPDTLLVYFAGHGLYDKKYVVRRALVGAPDPRQSRCVIIGVSDYATLPKLSGVGKNLVELRSVLEDPEIWGIPSGGVKTIDYPKSADDITNAISTAGQDASDTLLVYFAGHGLYDEHGLLLALSEATGKDSKETAPWKELADAIRNAGSRRKIIFLDCCYAGLALPDKDAQPEKKDPSELLKDAEVEGTYLLAAAQKYEEAQSPDEEGCTAFTGELVNVLRCGIASGPPTEEFLSLNSLHQQVRSALTKKQFPEPHRHDPDRIGQLPHFHNNMTRQPNSQTGVSSSRSGWRPPNFLRRKVVASFALFVVLIAVLIGWLLTRGSSEPPVSGLSLTKYCSALGPEGAQGFRVTGTDCVHQINLNEACEFQYRINGLEARFTSADPNSAVCYNPQTNVTYDAGISDMTGYCKSLTTGANVIATTISPGYEDTWICNLPINLGLACNAQNNQNDLVARQEENGGWMCYRD